MGPCQKKDFFFLAPTQAVDSEGAPKTYDAMVIATEFAKASSAQLDRCCELDAAYPGASDWMKYWSEVVIAVATGSTIIDGANKAASVCMPVRVSPKAEESQFPDSVSSVDSQMASGVDEAVQQAAPQHATRVSFAQLYNFEFCGGNGGDSLAKHKDVAKMSAPIDAPFVKMIENALTSFVWALFRTSSSAELHSKFVIDVESKKSVVLLNSSWEDDGSQLFSLGM